MPLVISDEVLQSAKLTEREALIEFACRLFDAGRMSLGHAGHIAGLTEDQMEQELIKREIPRYRYSREMFENDLATLKHLSESRDEDRDQ